MLAMVGSSVIAIWCGGCRRKVNGFTCMCCWNSRRGPIIGWLCAYTGARKWKSKRELRELILPPPSGLAPYQAAQRYVLVDFRAASQRYRFDLDNLLGALAALAYSVSDQQIRKLVQNFEHWLAQEGAVELRRTVESWLRTRLPEGLARHTVEMSSPCANQENQMADYRNGMPLFDTFAEQIMWGREQSGKQQLLEHQLRKRFGEIPSQYALALETAGPEEFEVWSERLLEGNALDQIFAPLPDEEDCSWPD